MIGDQFWGMNPAALLIWRGLRLCEKYHSGIRFTQSAAGGRYIAKLLLQ
jgi:hypothetical protein